MLDEQMRLWLIIIVITVLSGIGDSQGFVHAAKVWANDKLVWSEIGKSALGFAIGISLYWFVIKYMNAAGIAAPEIQTLVWFSITILGVAIISRNFFRWQTIDQIVGVAVLAGVAWLMVRTGG
jgi:hypothetical protein